MPLLRFVFVSLVGLAVFLTQANAALVALPNGGWTAGAPGPGQTDSQTFTTFGPDMTIAVNNNGASATGFTWSAGYPAINAVETTGGFTGASAQNGMQLFASSTSSTAAYIQTTISFAAPVYNLSFQIWDVDKSAGQFVDTISAIQALTNTGATIAATSVTSAVAGFNAITGSGLGTVVNGTAVANNTTNQGTIDITFSGPITQFSFKWSNSDPGLGQQAIGIGDIQFSTIPEASTMWPVAVLLGVVAGCRIFRRTKRHST